MVDVPTHDENDPRPFGQRFDEAMSRKVTPISAGRSEEQIAQDIRDDMQCRLEAMCEVMTRARRMHGMTVAFQLSAPDAFGRVVLTALEISKKLC